MLSIFRNYLSTSNSRKQSCDFTTKKRRKKQNKIVNFAITKKPIQSQPRPMSANLKNIKLAHFGGPPGSSGFGISASSGGAGKLPTNGTGGGKSAPPSSFTEAEVLATPGGVVIPIIRTRDVPKLLPTIANALQRPADDHLAAEDLDAVHYRMTLAGDLGSVWGLGGGKLHFNYIKLHTYTAACTCSSSRSPFWYWGVLF